LLQSFMCVCVYTRWGVIVVAEVNKKIEDIRKYIMLFGKIMHFNILLGNIF